jgi:hypothetical protein
MGSLALNGTSLFALCVNFFLVLIVPVVVGGVPVLVARPKQEDDPQIPLGIESYIPEE